MHFIRHWKPYFLAIIIVGFFFIAWDVFFTYQQVWGFNDEYLIGVRILGMPLEEYLFFLLIPYASVFIHYSLEYFYPNTAERKSYQRNQLDFISNRTYVYCFIP